jgi:hypothetical protein
MGKSAAHEGTSPEKSSFWFVLFKGGRNMPLQAGLTRYRGRIMNGLEADEFRRLERRLLLPGWGLQGSSHDDYA